MNVINSLYFYCLFIWYTSKLKNSVSNSLYNDNFLNNFYDFKKIILILIHVYRKISSTHRVLLYTYYYYYWRCSQKVFIIIDMLLTWHKIYFGMEFLRINKNHWYKQMLCNGCTIPIFVSNNIGYNIFLFSIFILNNSKCYNYYITFLFPILDC